MRTLIDLVDTQVKALDDLAKADKRSRAALIRDAVAEYLMKRRTSAASLNDAFGLWGNRTVDGLSYQKKMRKEWQGRFSIRIS